MNDPVFIIGTERSGTNLLRLMLDVHPNISVPHPPHIMKNFSGLEESYGDLEKDDIFRALIRDVARAVELHPYKWGIEIDREMVFRDARGRDLISIFFAVYDQYLASIGKKRWVCKSTFMIDHVDKVIRYRPGSKFLYMVRDGRDVAVSAKSSIFNHYSVYYTALLWKREQKTGIRWLRGLPSQQIMLVMYEHLIIDTERTLRNICDFLGEVFEPGMLSFYMTAEARKSASLNRSWINTARPVISGNSGKYKRCLSDNEIRLFESIAREELEFFSYNTLKTGTVRVGILKKLMFFIEELVRAFLVQTGCFIRDKNNILRYRKALFLGFLRLKLSIRRCV